MLLNLENEPYLDKGMNDLLLKEDNVVVLDEAPKEESKLDLLNKSSIMLFVGSANALVNGEKTLIDKTNDKVIATIVDSRTLVPVRFIAESFGAEVAVYGGRHNASGVTSAFTSRIKAAHSDGLLIFVSDDPYG